MYVIEQDCPDINDDNSIDISDVLAIVNIIMFSNYPDSEDAIYNHMDVNDDLIIDIIDLIALINIILSN